MSEDVNMSPEAVFPDLTTGFGWRVQRYTPDKDGPFNTPHLGVILQLVRKVSVERWVVVEETQILCKDADKIYPTYEVARSLERAASEILTKYPHAMYVEALDHHLGLYSYELDLPTHPNYYQ